MDVQLKGGNGSPGQPWTLMDQELETFGGVGFVHFVGAAALVASTMAVLLAEITNNYEIRMRCENQNLP